MKSVVPLRPADRHPPMAFLCSPCFRFSVSFFSHLPFSAQVVIGAPWKITKDLLTSLNIHCVVSGTNTKMDRDFEQAALGGKPLEDAYAEPKAQGIFKEIETTHSLTTEDVVRRLIKNREDYEKRNAKRAPKESAYLSQQKQFIAEI